MTETEILEILEFGEHVHLECKKAESMGLHGDCDWGEIPHKQSKFWKD